MRVSILQQLAIDVREYERHKLDPADMTPLHRLHCQLVAFMRTVPPWSRQEYAALIEDADRQAATAPPEPARRARALR
jgi:hypothetical protein